MVEPEQRESIISSKRSLDSICDEFEAALKSGKRVRIESFTDRTRSASSKTRMLQALLEIELEHVLKERVPQEEEYLVRFPEEVACVKKAFEIFLLHSSVPDQLTTLPWQHQNAVRSLHAVPPIRRIPSDRFSKSQQP